MSELLREVIIEITAANFDGMNDGQAFSVCKLWKGWAVANASSFSPHEWTAVVQALCTLLGRYSDEFENTI